MKILFALLASVLLFGCGAFTNPDGTPMTREQIRAEIHDGLAASSQVAHEAGQAGLPYAELIATGLGLLSTVFVAKSSGDRHAAVLKHALAPGSIQPVVEKKVG